MKKRGTGPNVRTVVLCIDEEGLGHIVDFSTFDGPSGEKMFTLGGDEGLIEELYATGRRVKVIGWGRVDHPEAVEFGSMPLYARESIEPGWEKVGCYRMHPETAKRIGLID